MIANCQYLSRDDTMKSSPRLDALQHTPLSASDQLPLLLILWMIIMFLRWQTTACETLRSLGITPSHRYGLCRTFIRVSSLHWCPQVFLFLHWFTILYSPHLWNRCYCKELIPVTRLVAPYSVRLARCSLRPREFTASLTITFCCVSPAPVSDRIGNLPPFYPFGAMCLIQGYTLHLAKLARGTFVPTHRDSQKLQSDLVKSCSGRPPCLLDYGSLPG
jgi:hypothetical protein